jgi:hypothetical protein
LLRFWLAAASLCCGTWPASAKFDMSVSIVLAMMGTVQARAKVAQCKETDGNEDEEQEGCAAQRGKESE